jgi:hypothetical protein
MSDQPEAVGFATFTTAPEQKTSVLSLLIKVVNFLILILIAFELYQLVFVAYPLQLQYYKECSISVLCRVGELRSKECEKYAGNVSGLDKLINLSNGTADIEFEPSIPFYRWSK